MTKLVRINFLIMDIEKITGNITDMAVQYAPKVVLAIITLIIGNWVIKKIINFMNPRIIQATKDESLAKFLGSILGIGLKIMLLLSVASMFGINTTSFVAIFGALMVGVGMALNGSIGHLASGVMLMIFKPFKVGDLVKIGGAQSVGTVEAINAFNTTLLTLDNKKIIIANSNVTGNDITNISGQGIVGVEVSYKVALTESVDKVKDIVARVGKECSYVLDEPAQAVVVANLTDNSIEIASRPFCKSEHYWDTLFYMQENVKKNFDKEGIKPPFQKMEMMQSTHS